jgi:hypothetical protein
VIREEKAFRRVIGEKREEENKVGRENSPLL